jgi:hypothetical protein
MIEIATLTTLSAARICVYCHVSPERNHGPGYLGSRGLKG